jgi:hypothetical protein
MPILWLFYVFCCNYFFVVILVNFAIFGYWFLSLIEDLGCRNFGCNAFFGSTFGHFWGLKWLFCGYFTFFVVIIVFVVILVNFAIFGYWFLSLIEDLGCRNFGCNAFFGSTFGHFWGLKWLFCGYFTFFVVIIVFVVILVNFVIFGYWFLSLIEDLGCRNFDCNAFFGSTFGQFLGSKMTILWLFYVFCCIYCFCCNFG